MGETAISWTAGADGRQGKTWNPVRGCNRVCSSGTTQTGCGDAKGGACYAEVQAERIVRMSRARGVPEGQGPYDGLVRMTPTGPRWTGKTRFVAEHLADPLRWRDPVRVFVNSMSDLFHDGFTNEEIAAVFGVMAAARKHTFIVLTKRPDRARSWFDWFAGQSEDLGGPDVVLARELAGYNVDWDSIVRQWPLPNVILGVSICNPADLADRAPLLRDIPAAVRAWSVEPQLEDLGDVSAWLGNVKGCGWLINGCESGARARPMNVAWARSMRDQCAAAGVPYFCKQLVESQGWAVHRGPGSPAVMPGQGSHRKRDGIVEVPYLDGIQHRAWPEVAGG